jgi:hypothetical protein
LLALQQAEGIEEEVGCFLSGESSGTEDDKVCLEERQGAAGHGGYLEEGVDVNAIANDGEACLGNAAESSVFEGDSFAAGDVVAGEPLSPVFRESDAEAVVRDSDPGEVAGDMSECGGDSADDIRLMEEGEYGDGLDCFEDFCEAGQREGSREVVCVQGGDGDSVAL